MEELSRNLAPHRESIILRMKNHQEPDGNLWIRDTLLYCFSRAILGFNCSWINLIVMETSAFCVPGIVLSVLGRSSYESLLLSIFY